MSTHNGVNVYTAGIFRLSACAPSDMPLEEVTTNVNIMYPTGISPWAWADGENFKGGEPNPCKCSQDPTKLHYLFHC